MQRLFVALAVVVAVVSATQCSGVVNDIMRHRSYEFNLSMLHHNDSVYVDTLWYRTEDNRIFYVNFCGQTASVCESQDTSVCIRVPDGDDYKYISGGSTSTQKISIAEAKDQTPSTSVTVTYSDGGQCDNGGRYKTKMYVNCQETANPGFFYGIDETNSCEPILYMWSSAGCGKRVPYIDPSDSSSSPAPGFCSGIVKDVKGNRSYEFDLSILHHNNSVYDDTLWYRTEDNKIFYVNFCGQTASACESQDTSVCIRVSTPGGYQYISGGSTSTQKISIAEAKDQSPSSSVTVTYSDGEKCGGGRYKTKIYVNCQLSANPGYFYGIDETNPCEPILYMWSSAGCGKEVIYRSSSSSSTLGPSDFDSSESCSVLGSKPLFSVMMIIALVWMLWFK